MAENWYYVQKGDRHGPVDTEVIESMMKKQELSTEDYVWKKGFENWKKIKDVSELKMPVAPPQTPDLPPMIEEEEQDKPFSLRDISEDERIIFIRIGNDRGEAPSDYGPFDLKQLQQLYREKRINGKTFIFTPDLKEWKILAEMPDYQEIFEDSPPEIKESDRRASVRRPFVARMFVQNNRQVFEGICRDISVGGMQVLLEKFEGAAGDKITLNVHPDNSEYQFTASGVVVRILEGNAGFSFRFQNLNDEAKRAIEKYVQEN